MPTGIEIAPIGLNIGYNQRNSTAFKAGTVITYNPKPSADTVEINNKNKKKDSAVKFILGTLGVGVGFLAVGKWHNTSKLKKIGKKLSEIFEREISAGDAKEITDRYKKILEVKDDKEYLEKLFSQLKKDFGLERSTIKLNIENFSRKKAPNWAAMLSDTGVVLTVRTIDGKFASRKNLFSTLFHEFTHRKQDDIAIATNLAEYEDAIASKKLREYSKRQIKKHGGPEAVKKWLKERGREIMEPEFKRVQEERGQLPKDSDLYKRGLRYIDGLRNYIKESELKSNPEAYRNNVLELEAYRAGDLATEIYEKIA